jgi:hypothetical protein
MRGTVPSAAIFGGGPMILNKSTETLPLRVGWRYTGIAVIVIFGNSYAGHKINSFFALIESIDETVLFDVAKGHVCFETVQS